MSRHVDHLLAAYVERQLKPEQAARVYQHSRQCPRCWARLARHERLTEELRLSLGQSPSLHPNRVRQLWLATGAAPIVPSHRHNTSLLLPIMISLVLLVAPLTTDVSGMMSSSALAATASHAPGDVAAQAWPALVSTSIFPLPDTEPPSLTVAATPAVDKTPLPIEPVPLAPSTP